MHNDKSLFLYIEDKISHKVFLAKLLSMRETYSWEMYKSQLPLAVWIMHDFVPGKYP